MYNIFYNNNNNVHYNNILYAAISRAMSNIFNLSSSIDEGGNRDLNTRVTERIPSSPPSLTLGGGRTAAARVVVIRKLLAVHTPRKRTTTCALQTGWKKSAVLTYCRGWANVYRHGDGSQTDLRMKKRIIFFL